MAHPVEMVLAFTKTAESLLSEKRDRRGVSASIQGRESVPYTAPNPPVATTRPDLVESQKALPPPPVQ